jgi:hypothetical protein
MHVRGGDEAVRADNRFDQDIFTIRVLGSAMEDEHLTGDRVLEPVS